MPFLILFFLFVTVPIVEVAIFIQIGGIIGLWPTLALIILTAALGTALIRWQGIGLVRTARAQSRAGKLPVFEVFSGLCLLIAGALLLTPGFLTDGIGFCLLFPPFRRLLYASVEHRIAVKIARERARGRPAPDGGQPPRSSPRNGDVIEGEWDEVDKDPEPREMPPPGGGWGPRP